MKARSVVLAAALMLGSTAGLSSAASAQAKAQASRPLLNTLKDIGEALGGCWIPPPLVKSRPGTQITVLITFNRSGEVMGEPRFTFITPGISQEIRTAYQLSVADAISRCVPMAFSPSLAGAVAGRPFTMRYDDTRGQKGAENSWLTTITS
jgi:hypothetical protein